VVKIRHRDVDRAAVVAFVPVIAVLPLWALAMVPFWLVLRAVTGIGYIGALGVYLAVGFIQVLPSVQRRLVSAFMGARPPTASEAAKLQQAFDEVAQALHIRDRHFAVGVVDADDLNAFACGGHLVVVTSFAIRELDHRALCGVLVHELCHHLGSHTIALTVQQWLMLPVSTLSWLGATLRNVAVAATDTFGSRSRSIDIGGRVAAPVFSALSRFFEFGGAIGMRLTNVVGRSAEFQADQRVIRLGYGRHLADALRRTIDDRMPTERRTTWRRLLESHPPARTRVARIEAALRQRRHR
jgi:Zn-dependent protease with chaperone function